MWPQSGRVFMMCLVLIVLGLLSDLISPHGPQGIDHAVLVASSHSISEDKVKSGEITEVAQGHTFIEWQVWTQTCLPGPKCVL